VKIMTVADRAGADSQASGKPPAQVTSSTRVNVAFPFSQVKITEPSEHLIALTGLVAELADLLAATAGGPDAEALRSRARDLASELR
jgi:hypothetical protein